MIPILENQSEEFNSMLNSQISAKHSAIKSNKKTIEFDNRRVERLNKKSYMDPEHNFPQTYDQVNTKKNDVKHYENY